MELGMLDMENKITVSDVQYEKTGWLRNVKE